MKYFVVADTHGCFTPLRIALKSAGFDAENEQHMLVMCGDMFDRGNQAMLLYEFVKGLGDRFVYVRGNHEDLLFLCVDQIVGRKELSTAHFSNMTADTVAQLTGHWSHDFWLPADNQLANDVHEKMSPILSWIKKKMVNYYEIGDKYICVHGWIPCRRVSDIRNPYIYNPDWRSADERAWSGAIWMNGMDMANYGVIEPNKTIICGHWNSSYGHRLYEGKDISEFGTDADFSPYYNKGIVAIDACTARSNKVNCIVIDV